MLNLPNTLTIIRIALIPIFLVFLMIQTKLGAIIAVIIFIIAAVTDGLDGYIARKRKEITKIGKLLDPLADKLLITSALVSLVELGKLPSWIVIIIISREFIISGLRMVAATEGIVISASIWGKIKTITQITAIVSVLLDSHPFNLTNLRFSSILLIISVIFTIISGIDYIIKSKNIFLKNNIN